CQASIRSGFTSVMMDGSLEEDVKTPSTYEYNVDVTRKVTEMAHAIGVSVEGELGCLGSLESGMAGDEDGVGAEDKLSHDQLLTDPEQAADFVRKTGVDALAIAIGTSHGAYKFSREPTGDILAIDRVRAIHTRLPNTHLVMHGSSSVPQEWLAIIREYGGEPCRRDQRGHSQWCSQGEHRYRHSPCDDRRDPPGPREGQERVRSAQAIEGCYRGGEGHLHCALRGVRKRRTGVEAEAFEIGRASCRKECRTRLTEVPL